LYVIGKFLQQPIHFGAAHILVRHFAATMKDHGFYFMTLAQEANDLVLAHLIIVLGGGGPKFHFFNMGTLLIFLGFVRFLALLVEKFSVIHDFADRRDGVGRNLHNIQTHLARLFHRVEEGHNAQLISLIVNHTEFASAYSLVDPEPRGTTTFCDKPTSWTRFRRPSPVSSGTEKTHRTTGEEV